MPCTVARGTTVKNAQLDAGNNDTEPSPAKIWENENENQMYFEYYQNNAQLSATECLWMNKLAVDNCSEMQ